MKTHNIYVSRSGGGPMRLARAVQTGTWGVDVADVGELLHLPRDKIAGVTGRDALASIEVGDAVLFAIGGPEPRVASGRWRDAEFAQAVLGRVTHGYYEDDEPIWDDAVREHRFQFYVVTSQKPAYALDFGEANAEALRVSANSYGLPVAVDVTVPLVELQWPEPATVA